MLEISTGGNGNSRQVVAKRFCLMLSESKNNGVLAATHKVHPFFNIPRVLYAQRGAWSRAIDRGTLGRPPN